MPSCVPPHTLRHVLPRILSNLPTLALMGGALLGVAGCSSPGNSLPTAAITSPAGGSVLYPGLVTFTGTVGDLETAPDLLVASFTAGDQSCKGTAAADGTVSCSLNLAAEQSWTVTLDVVDKDGGKGVASLTVSTFDAAPTVLIDSPADGSSGYTSNSDILFVAKVTDPDDLLVTCTWSSSIDGELGASEMDQTTETCTLSRSGLTGNQTHYIQVEAEDGFGKAGTASIYLPVTGCTDSDGDGISRECDNDCNDADPFIYPGAPEQCDSKDNDCNGAIDDAPDQDGDGFNICKDCDDLDPGVNPVALEICDGKDNNCLLGVDEGYDKDRDTYVSCATGQGPADCDDGDAAINPGASELCNGLDDNCNGLIDDGAQETFYADADGDSYGDPDTSVDSCKQPGGTVTRSGDCNDSSAQIYPGAAEACNGKDDNCDSQIDEGVIPNTYYLDGDSDGFGTSTSTTGCVLPSGYAIFSGDCNDADVQVSPGVVERCDGKDNNCNTQIDEGVIVTYYRDKDGDGFGVDGPDKTTGCTAPTGYAANPGDCNDGDAGIYPTANEQCDGKDNDCNSKVDDNVTTYTWYYDKDLDGYGTGSNTQVNCSKPAGYVSAGGDCDDNNPAINPGIAEVCDGKDNNCNSQFDEGVQTRYWQDADKDTYGGTAVSVMACSAPAGYVLSSTDCNDNNATVYPNASELCDGLDNNCNGTLDEGQPQKTFYKDGDGDGYGSATATISACVAPATYVTNNADCNDSSAATYPGAKEVCDGADNDCDSVKDEGTECYDDDLDGWTEKQGDCNDANKAIFPGATEVCNAVDDNCNSTIDEGFYAWPDADKDTYGSNSGRITTCSIPSGYVAKSGDCDDTRALIYPGAPEVFNGLDDNCDGKIDGTLQLAQNPVALVGDAAKSGVGATVARIGDVNGDGLDDLAVGAPLRNAGKGTAFVVFGKTSGWATGALATQSLVLDDDGAGAQAGFAIAGAGDLDGDGIDDLAVGAPYRSSTTLTEAGRMYLLYGDHGLGIGQATLGTVAAASADGIQNYVWLGYSLSGGNDLDAKGMSDLMLGAPWPTTVANGYLMILPGKTTRYKRTIGISDLVKVLGGPGDGLGISVSTMEPVGSSDNTDDMIVAGLGDTSGPQGKKHAGVVYYVPGSTKLTPSDSYINVSELNTISWRGDADDEEVGYNSSNVGDLNSDGYGDFLISVAKQGGTTPAAAYLVLGGVLPPNGSMQSAADVYFTGETTGCPCTVAGVGDVNGDMIPDFVVGASHSSAGGTDSGAVYLFYGSATGVWQGVMPLSSATTVFVGAAGDLAGSSVSPAGDINGDGYDDFLIGAPGYDANSLTDVGRVFVVFGYKK